MRDCRQFVGRLLFPVIMEFLYLFPAYTQSIIINEIYNSSSNDEWVELLVVQDSLDLRNWDIRDFSSDGNPQLPLVFSSNSLWSSVRKGTIIVIATPSVSLTEDTDPSDFILQIKSSNASYFSGTVFSIAGSSDAVQIRNASDVHIFGVSWGSANAASLPSPKVHFTSGPSSSNSISFNEDSLPELTSTANWNTSASPTRGAGNTITNSAWITSLQTNPTGDGSGTAVVDPDTMTHGETSTLAITYGRDISFTITDMRIIIPSAFNWSHSTSDISFSDMTATKSVISDTVYLTTLTMNADSTVISISSVIAPDSTAIYPIKIQTKAQINYNDIVPTPNIVVFGLPQPIVDIKGNDTSGIILRNGELITCSGIVTAANEFGGPSYIQDNSGGVAIYGSSFSASANIGDEVIVSGNVSQYYGLCELTAPKLHQIVSSGNAVIPMILITSQIKNDGLGGVENFEGLLVRISSVTVRDTFNNSIPTWSVSGSGTNYRLIDASGYIDIRVDNNVNFANTPAPQGLFDVIGVVSQFKTSAPYIGGYQLMPRASADILTAGPLFAILPIESNITSTSLRIRWETVNSGTSRLRYGTTISYELGVLSPDDILRISHSIDVNNLQTATIYHIQAYSVAGGDTSTASDLIVSTSSPSATTGQVHVYFNKSIDASVSAGEIALGNQDLVSRLVQRINNANHSIDAAIYSLSGTAGASVATALVAAKNRGTKVRVIGEYGNRTTAPWTTLTNSFIPVIFDLYGSNDGTGLMHNKFIVIDYRGGAPESVWVWTGSWNLTDPGTNNDRQNAIEIQDIALASAYTSEFNEMWGSSTDIPNSSSSRFGSRKIDNTPHNFNVSGIPVNLYFSPSDHPTMHIAATLARAQHSISSCMLTLTRKDLADTMISSKDSGEKVRIILDNNTDVNSQYSDLLSHGVDIHLKGGTGLLHHKYAVIDGELLSGSQYLITGSHNWTNSAENSNDENTLVIQSNRISNLYLQEFAARYYEAGGTDSLHLSAYPLFSVSSDILDFGSINSFASKTETVIVSNHGSASLIISSVNYSNPHFTCSPSSVVIIPSTNQKFNITFHAPLSGHEFGNLVFLHNAQSSPDTIEAVGDVIYSAITDSIYVNEGWNMISVPVISDETMKNSLFPTTISQAFSYEGSYVVKDTLEFGKGYWLKFPADETTLVRGMGIGLDTIDVLPSWNLIGTISGSVPINSIIQIPEDIVRSPYFGYAGSYHSVDTLNPSNAYWVKVDQPGKLVLSTNFINIRKAKLTFSLNQFNSFTFTNATGKTQTLYIGTIPYDGDSLNFFELPPIPPENAFDVRYGSGKFVEFYVNDLPKPAYFPIKIKSRDFPIILAWSLDSNQINSYTLYSKTHNGTTTFRVEDNGRVILDEEVSRGLTLKVLREQNLPKMFLLNQNYPNPLNPKTKISYELPSKIFVRIVVYDLLGREIYVLVAEEQEAGYHEAFFSAENVTSGIYIYRLVTGKISLTRKMVVIK